MTSLRQIEEIATNFIASSPLNTVPALGNMKIYDAPIFGVANAFDPLFADLKNPEIIGEHHLTPSEWLPEAHSVVSFFLPFTQEVRRGNYIEGTPAIEWLYARIEGELCNNALRQLIRDILIKNKEKAVSPAIDSRFQQLGYSSNWSERHAAFIAGLGTFSLNKSLITKKGCAGRYGSVITSARLDALPRSYTDIYEYCSKCGACVSRCPAGAISLLSGKDHVLCSAFVDGTKKKYAPRYGCGKCQTKVPCEDSLPL